MNVVIRYQPILKKWFICHAETYQNAFGNLINGFVFRGNAVDFAVSNKCTVVFHEFDQLQRY